MNMEARIVKWQELAKTKISSTESWEMLRRESMQRAEEKRMADMIQTCIEKVPMRFRHKSFSDYLTDITAQLRIKKIAGRFVETFNERAEEGTNVIFLGSPGT